MRVGPFVATALTLVACSLATGAHADEEQPGWVQGHVFRASDGGPLADIRVALQDAPDIHADTGTAGAFRFELPPGVYVLRISQPGRNPELIPGVTVAAGKTTEVLITLHADQRRPMVDIEAPPLPESNTTPPPSDTEPGRIRGSVSSLETGAPVVGARVFVRGSQIEATTDAQGRFELELPAGVVELSVIHVDHATQAVPHVEVHAGETADIEVELSPAAFLLDTFTVSAPRIEGGTASLLAERRDAASVSDVIGAEQMAKSGDSNAAAALRRVTGLTVVGGKYVYVRGLGERYSSTLLNRSTLPSPEPERRVIPMDVFPAALLEGVMIPKTYSADLPGEFGGGTVQVRTRRIPAEPVRDASVSVGGDSGTTFAPGLIYRGGALDWTGFDDGTRRLPGPVDAASQSSPLRETDQFSSLGYTADELEAFGESMPNTWATETRTLPPDLGASVTLGDRFHLAELPAGYLAALTYSNGWHSDKRERTYYLVGSGGALEPGHHYNFDSSENSVSLGGILNFGLEPNARHQFGATTTLVRGTDNEARFYQGYNRDAGKDIRVTRLRWIERTLLAQQLTGTHHLSEKHDLTVDWRYTFALARRLEPDRREYRYDYEDSSGLWYLSDRPEGNQRVFSDLHDYNHDFAADVKMALPWLKDKKATLSAGPSVVFKDRAVDTRRFKFLHKGPISTNEDVLQQDPEHIFVPENIGPDGFQFEEITRQTDNYEASQRIFAGYALADLELPANLRIAAGLRLEHSTQEVTTFELFNPADVPVVADLSTTDLLPSANVSWALAEDWMVRGGFSRTVSRPEFRELSPATFNDVTGGRQIFGNPDLQRAMITSFDVRGEWYPSSDEIISLGGFYKRFDQPIETVVIVSAQHSISYDNAKSATNYGVELELRKGLGFVTPALRDFFAATNAAFIQSEVELDTGAGQIQTSSKRPLQGQSPYVINVQAGWDRAERGMYVTLLYNLVGPRISEVGAEGAPDVIEEPAPQLDLVAGCPLRKGWTLSLKARNLLDPVYRHTQGGHETETYRQGRSISLGLKRSF